jgi:hypothetical protein
MLFTVIDPVQVISRLSWFGSSVTVGAEVGVGAGVGAGAGSVGAVLWELPLQATAPKLNNNALPIETIRGTVTRLNLLTFVLGRLEIYR